MANNTDRAIESMIADVLQWLCCHSRLETREVTATYMRYTKENDHSTKFDLDSVCLTHSEWVNNKYLSFYEKHGYLPKYFDVYNALDVGYHQPFLREVTELWVVVLCL